MIFFENIDALLVNFHIDLHQLADFVQFWNYLMVNFRELMKFMDLMLRLGWVMVNLMPFY